MAIVFDEIVVMVMLIKPTLFVMIVMSEGPAGAGDGESSDQDGGKEDSCVVLHNRIPDLKTFAPGNGSIQMQPAAHFAGLPPRLA